MGNKNLRSAYFSPKNWLWGSVSGLNGNDTPNSLFRIMK